MLQSAFTLTPKRYGIALGAYNKAYDLERGPDTENVQRVSHMKACAYMKNGMIMICSGL